MIVEGKNVCSTHALFKNANDITRESLKANRYILILDEVMNVVEEMKDFTTDDMNTMMADNLISIEDDYVIWNEEKKNYDGRYNDIRDMARNKSLIYANNKLLFWNFPVDIFDYFKEVYILTYMFKCQVQRYYYDFHNVKYKMYQINDSHQLQEYDESLHYERRMKLTPLINICDLEKYNIIGDADTALSLNWYGKYEEMLPILKSNLYNWFNNGEGRKDKNNERLWTTFKAYESKLKGKGFTKRFISLNIRATNEYIDSKRLAYCCNRYVKPSIKTFFRKRGISIDENAWALTEMLQWIWRGRVRKYEPIDIYIPSKRMRELLTGYLQPIK